jgi:hypothetical protein
MGEQLVARGVTVAGGAMNTDRAADAAAAFSVPAWVISMAANALPLVQVAAGILAIVASCFAIVVHLKKLREK